MRACGRFEVEDAEADRAVGRGVARELLALLVLRRDDPIDVSDIVDALWPSEPPATARTIVHGAVSRLRRALGADAVWSTEDGYVLDGRHVEVDLWVGLDHLDAGRTAAAAATLVDPLLGRYATRPWALGALESHRRAVAGVAHQAGDPWVVEPPTGPVGALSRLVGRRRELQALRTALDRSRLVTIVGLGGVGKTRLATEALLDVTGTVVRVDLGRGRGSFADGLSGAVGAVPSADEGVARAVLGNLLEGVELLVVDGCEVDVDGAADAIALLLQRRPGLRVLVTSRTALGVAGEHLIPLLPFDQPGDPRGDAVDLLLDRVRSLGLPFVEGDRERAAAICRSCAGVPLAIELAAAELLDGHVASSEPTRAPAIVLRQRIDAAITGLTPASVALARRIALLGDGTTVALAERLGEGGGPAAVRELLSAGLMGVEARPEGRRFHLLDTIRLAFLERVDAEDRAVAAHSLADLARPASPPAGAGPDVGDLARAVPEIENATGLLRTLADAGEHVARLEVARAFATPWGERGYNTFGGEELLSAAEACRHSGAIDAVTWSEVVATSLDVLQSFEAAAEQLDLITEALPAAIEAGRDDVLAWLEFTRACGLGYRGDMGGAMVAIMAARDAADRAGAVALALRVRSLLAVAWARTGDRAGPRAAMEEVTRRVVELGWHGQAARSYLAMAQMARSVGDRDQALADVRHGEEHAAAGLSRVSMAWLRLERAEIELELVDGAGSPLRSDLVRVREALEAAVDVADAVGQVRIAGMCRVRLGVLDGDASRLADAATTLLTVDRRSAALALANLHPLLGPSHQLRGLLPDVVAVLTAEPGGMLVSDADVATVEALAATAEGRLPPEWRELLHGGLLDLAVAGGR